MALPVAKLFSCISYAIRISYRLECSPEVMSHLQQARACLKCSVEDALQSDPPEREVKRRRVISLSTCLGMDHKTHHHNASSQTDGHHVDEQELVKLMEEVQQWGSKMRDTVTHGMQELRGEFDSTLARNTRHQAENLQCKERVIAALQSELDELRQALGRGPYLASQRSEGSDAGLSENGATDCTLKFLSWMDAVALSQCSRFHVERFGFPDPVSAGIG
mmetsp:Transcript_8602/g.10397  ORF Transcript_8602/g.10397 Transcript_8602/m.10397 type:complete len:220 (+) Transcript_8602:108-767(+)|eukprot:Skav210665  [mRNA]  locus=scaffold697:78985:79644:+ [translate_table: standard]